MVVLMVVIASIGISLALKRGPRHHRFKSTCYVAVKIAIAVDLVVLGTWV